MLNSQHSVSAKEQGSRLLKTPRGPLELLLSTREAWLAKVNSMFFRVCLKFSAPPVALAFGHHPHDAEGSF